MQSNSGLVGQSLLLTSCLKPSGSVSNVIFYFFDSSDAFRFRQNQIVFILTYFLSVCSPFLFGIVFTPDRYCFMDQCIAANIDEVAPRLYQSVTNFSSHVGYITWLNRPQ